MPKLRVAALGSTKPGRALQQPGRANLSQSPYSRYQQTIQSQVPSLYWMFDETEVGTTARDASGNARHGTHSNSLISNAAPLLTGDDGRFARSSFYVSASSNRTDSSYSPFVEGNTITVTGWFQPAVGLTSRTLFGSNAATNGTVFRTSSTGTALSLFMNFTTSGSASATWTLTGGTNAADLLVLGQTAHYAIVIRSGADTAELYVNGVSRGTQSFINSTTWHAAVGTFKVGAYQTGSAAFDGFIDDTAVFERELTRDEVQAQYVAGSGNTQGDGAQAPQPLSVQPPDYSAYTVRTITAEEASAAVTESQILLDDSTDYLIHAPQIIRRTLEIKGGRNIVCMGMHCDISNKGIYPSGTFQRGISFVDGDTAPVDREIHFEGLYLTGNDLGTAIAIAAPTARFYFGYCRGDTPHQRSSDARGVGGPSSGGSYGYQGYSAREWTHPDSMHALGGHRGITIERSTFLSSGNGLSYQDTAGPPTTAYSNRIRNVNLRAALNHGDEEGPMTDNGATFSSSASRYTWEANVQSWEAGALGATVSWNSATPITGAGSLQISKTGTDREIFARIPFGAATDWSHATPTNNAIRLKVRLDSGGGGFPMARVDVIDSTLYSQQGETGWYMGNPRKLIAGTAVDIVGRFPMYVLRNLRRVRIVLMNDATSDTHTITVDDMDTGDGDMSISPTGPLTEYTGQIPLYHDDDNAGPVEVTNLYVETRPNQQWVDSNTDHVRYWNGAGYTLDPPPGTADLTDATGPSASTILTDSISDYVIYPSSFWQSGGGVGEAIVRDGRALGGIDFCPEGIAGVNYVPPAQYEMLLDTCFAVSSATLVVTAPSGVVEVPLQTAACVSTATLTLTAPTRVVLATAACVSTGTLALTAPTTVTLASAACVSSATLALTAPALLTLATAACTSSATLALRAPTQVPLATAACVSTATLTLSAQTTIPLGTSACVSSATLALTAQTYIPLGTAAAVASATCAVTSPGVAFLTLETASAVSSATLALTAKTTVALGSAAATSSATLALTAPTKVVLGTAAATSSATLALTAPALLTLSTAAATSTATLALRAQANLSLVAAAQSSATLALYAPGIAFLTLETASVTSSATLALRAQTGIPLGSASAVSSGSLALSAATRIALGSSDATSAATLLLTTVQAQNVPLAPCFATSSGTLVVFAPSLAWQPSTDTNWPLTPQARWSEDDESRWLVTAGNRWPEDTDSNWS